MGGEQARERVLVIGDDMKIFLAVVRSLGRAGKEVHAAPFNWHSPALKSKYIAAVHHLPRYSDDPIGWRTAVLALMEEHRFDLIVPCCDRAILPLHVHRDEFAGYRVAIPTAEQITLMFDKERTKQLCSELHIPVAEGTRLSAADTAQDLADRFGLPLVIKPRKSYWLDRLDSSGKVWIVDTLLELQEVLGTITEPSRYLVERYFEGVGVGVSVLAQNGRILHAFQHRRLRQGRGGNSSYRVSERVDEAPLRACEKVCAHTGLTGVCMFEFRCNPQTQGWILVETNARFWGSSPLPLSIGVDFPRFLFDLLVHGVQHAPVQYPAGVRSRNLVLDGFNLLTGLRGLPWREIGAWGADAADYLAQPIRWMSGKERSDSFVKDDVRPGIWELAVLWRSLAQKLTRTRTPQPNRRAGDRGAAIVAQAGPAESAVAETIDLTPIPEQRAA